MMNIAICDDEVAWLEIIRDKLSDCLKSDFDFAHSITCFNSLKSLKDAIINKQVDFAFVDISMYDENSIDWAIENLQNYDIPIIFTTVYPQTAGNLYDCKNCCYYIIKTRLDQKLESAVEAAVKRIDNNGSTFIHFRGDDSKYKIRACDILYIDTSAGKNYLAVHKVNKKVINVPFSIKCCLEILPNFFLQCHNGCIVNCRHVVEPSCEISEGMYGKKYDERFFVLDSGDIVPITLRKYKEIVNKFYEIINKEH